MSGCQLVISVDGNSKAGMEFRGDEAHLLTLLGAITHTSIWINNRLQERQYQSQWQETPFTKVPIHIEESTELSGEKGHEYNDEQKLPRDKAIEATEYAISSLQLRVKKMKEAPTTATFVINPTLLEKL